MNAAVSRSASLLPWLLLASVAALPVSSAFAQGAPRIPPNLNVIQAFPNPCVIGPDGLCTSYLQWQAPASQNAAVFISVDGGDEILFACARSGSAPLPWIGASQAFEFRLYSTSSGCTARNGPPLARVTVSALTSPHNIPQPSVGMNKFDLATDYLGIASGGDGSAAYTSITKAMARKAMVDARSSGINYFRISMTGYGPVEWGGIGDLDLWRYNPDAYWVSIDEMLSDLRANEMRVIVSFIWNTTQFPSMTFEDTRQLITDPGSQSYQLALRYIREFISRYRWEPAVMMYDLTNELNLMADLDSRAACESGWWDPEIASRLCAVVGNFTSDEMAAFTSRLAAEIRKMDDSRPISSGFGLPRASAAHLRQRPGDWTVDSAEEFSDYFAFVHQGIDVLSAHLYNGGGDNERFGNRGHSSAGYVDVMKQAADRAGKPLFIGELGDQDPYSYDPVAKRENTSAAFSKNVLQKIRDLRIPYSALWLWEDYLITLAPDDSTPTPFNIEPGHTDRLIQIVKETNQDLGNPVPPGSGPDSTAPQLVVTAPFDGVEIWQPQALFALASDDQVVPVVEFWIDGALHVSLNRPPYRAMIDPSAMLDGSHEIIVRSFDAEGNTTESAVYVTTTGGLTLEEAEQRKSKRLKKRRAVKSKKVVKRRFLKRRITRAPRG